MTARGLTDEQILSLYKHNKSKEKADKLNLHVGKNFFQMICNEFGDEELKTLIVNNTVSTNENGLKFLKEKL